MEGRGRGLEGVAGRLATARPEGGLPRDETAGRRSESVVPRRTLWRGLLAAMAGVESSPRSRHRSRQGWNSLPSAIELGGGWFVVLGYQAEASSAGGGGSLWIVLLLLARRGRGWRSRRILGRGGTRWHYSTSRRGRVASGQGTGVVPCDKDAGRSASFPAVRPVGHDEFDGVATRLDGHGEVRGHRPTGELGRRGRPLVGQRT